MLYYLPCYPVGRLGAGTTRLCAGIVSVAKPISIECQMANYSNSLYQQLEEETGIKTGLPLLKSFHFLSFYLLHCCSEPLYNLYITVHFSVYLLLFIIFWCVCVFCISGYVKTGSLCLAQNQDRFISLKRLASRLK